MKFRDMYPKERFYAADLQGRPWTLTFSNPAVTYKLNEDGQRDLSIPPVWHFVETPKNMPAVLTNGVCARAIMQQVLGEELGDESDNWPGHKITLYPAEDTSGFSEDGLCIRVKGSPELQRPLEFRAQIGQRKKTFKMLPTGNGSGAQTAVNPVTGEVGAAAEPANQAAPAPQPAVSGDAGADAAAGAFTGPSTPEPATAEQPQLVPPAQAKTAVELAQENLERALQREATRPIAAGDVNWIATQCTVHGIEEPALLTYLTLEVGVDSVETIPAARLDEVKAWISGHAVPSQAAP